MVRLPVSDDTRLPYRARGSRRVPSRLRRRASNVLRFSNAFGDAPRLDAGRREDYSIEGIQYTIRQPSRWMEGYTGAARGRRTAGRETGKTIEDDEDGACRQRVGLVETRGMVRRMRNTHTDTVYTPESVLLRAESDPPRS